MLGDIQGGVNICVGTGSGQPTCSDSDWVKAIKSIRWRNGYTVLYRGGLVCVLSAKQRYVA